MQALLVKKGDLLYPCYIYGIRKMTEASMIQIINAYWSVLINTISSLQKKVFLSTLVINSKMK
ncbi:hypothetical protein CRENPOLYSF1_470005 [Crenothrix polyspora]|uniref:Uncharacterized protein n=1 Tax=Crenothrix polyspora TaxID=360316 RepID=A0A1R4HBQ3_9GAMM|nr:hypothetical protein CRENPOLYSF1_470005 [Crenothrix polyspora]